MKKKSIFAIMLVALVLTLSLVVSCQPDPDYDDLYGTWVCNYAANTQLILDSDGLGTYTLTVKYMGNVMKTETDSYTLSNGFVVVDEKSNTHTSSEPEYLFIHEDGGYAHIGLHESSTGCVYSDNPAERDDYMNYYHKDLTIAGTTYSSDSITVTIDGSNLTLDIDYQVKTGGSVLVYEEIVKGTATCASTGLVYTSPEYAFYNETYSTRETRTKYVINGNTLTLYVFGLPLDFTKQ